MTATETLKGLLSRTFAEAVEVRAVPSGLAISAPFTDSSGDRISFYARSGDDGYTFEDDGFFLSHLVASGIDIERGQRRQLLDSVLEGSGAYWDTDTLEIRSRPSPNVGTSAIMFMSALMRLRDIELLTKDVIRSTFKEDATIATEEVLGESFTIESGKPLAAEFADIPPDIVVTPKRPGLRRAGVFFVNSSTPFVEAEMLHMEIEKAKADGDFASIALIEDTGKLQMIGMRRFQRAHNRGLETPIFRGDEKAAMAAIGRTLGLKLAA